MLTEPPRAQCVPGPAGPDVMGCQCVTRSATSAGRGRLAPDVRSTGALATWPRARIGATWPGSRHRLGPQAARRPRCRSGHAIGRRRGVVGRPLQRPWRRYSCQIDGYSPRLHSFAQDRSYIGWRDACPPGGLIRRPVRGSEIDLQVASESARTAAAPCQGDLTWHAPTPGKPCRPDPQRPPRLWSPCALDQLVRRSLWSNCS